MKKIYSLLLSIYALFFPNFIAFAQDVPAIGLTVTKQPGGIKITGNDATAAAQIGTVFQNIITLFFTIGAVGFVIMFLWGAVDWILSGGDKEKIAGARKRIVTAVTGLVLLSLTFVVMIVLGQILGLKTLYSGEFTIPSLINK